MFSSRSALTAAIFFAALFVIAPAHAKLVYSQKPDPFKALENTKGNIGFIKLTNDDPNDIAFVTEILAFQFNPTGGEADDQATNLALVAPNPTVANPLQIAANNGFANIKFSWDAVDLILDNDIDYGDWAGIFTVTYHYVRGTDVIAVVKGNVRVLDRLPEPSSLAVLGPVLGALLLVRRRRAARKGRCQP